MLNSNHDNKKFELEEYQTAYIINNNSNVNISQNNNVALIRESQEKENFNPSTINNIATITINKGNTVGDISTTSLQYTTSSGVKNSTIVNYDIVYGNSVLNSSNTISSTLHEYLTDYNFPAARWLVNGYKSNYAILLNNGLSTFWTSADKGVLVNDLNTSRLDLIPTRMNGYTAEGVVLNSNALTGKYNGTIILSNIPNSINGAGNIKADFVYNLQINYSTYSGPMTLQFSNIAYLTIKSRFNNEVILRNVSYSLVNTTKTITAINSNITMNALNLLSRENSCNTVATLNINSNQYKEYILSGTKQNQLFNNVNRNIITDVVKYQKQTPHPYTETLGYNSNVPIGSIAWYPQAWAAFNPAHDKDSSSEDKVIHLKGVPNSYDWALCDGSSVPNNSLYTQIYGETTTPNYKVNENFYEGLTTDCKSYHFLTQPSVIQIVPSTIFHMYITGVGGKIRETGGNQHSRTYNGVKQIMKKGSYKAQMCTFLSQWRAHSVLSVYFYLDTKKLQLPSSDIINKFAIQFDSYCCYGGGDGWDYDPKKCTDKVGAWWRAWTGGNIGAMKENKALPTTNVYKYKDENGKELISTNCNCIGGYPSSRVVLNLNGKELLWWDTINCPKLAVTLDDATFTYFDLKCVSGDCVKMFKNTVNGNNAPTKYNQRIGYRDTNGVLHMDRKTGGKNHRGYRECNDIFKIGELSDQFENKTYQVVLKKMPPASADGVVTGIIKFQLGMPTVYASMRSYQWDPFDGRWSDKKGVDYTDSTRLYKMYYGTNYVTMYRNVRLNYMGVEIPVRPPKKATETGEEIVEEKLFDWTTHHHSSSDSNWPQHPKYTTKFKNSGTYYNYGLFRRLNPWIKINDENNIREIQYEEEYDEEDMIPVIKIRKEFNRAIPEQLNLNSVKNNVLSVCYCPDYNNNEIDWTAFNMNIQSFEYKIHPKQLEKIQNQTIGKIKLQNQLLTSYYKILQYDEVDEKFKYYTVSNYSNNVSNKQHHFFKYENGTEQECTIYDDEANGCYYLKFDKRDQYKKIFNNVKHILPNNVSGVAQVNDISNNSYTTLYTYLDIQTHKLHQFKQNNSDSITNAANAVDLNYTIYNVTKTNNIFTLSINKKLLKLSNCYRMLQNNVNYIKNLFSHNYSNSSWSSKEYYNTATNNLPIFWKNDRSQLNNNNMADITTYYYLGTQNQVMSATAAVKKYIFEYKHFLDYNDEGVETYNSFTATVNNSNTITIYEEKNGSLTTVTSANLADEKTYYIQVTNKNLTSSDVNKQIYNTIYGCTKWLKTKLTANTVISVDSNSIPLDDFRAYNETQYDAYFFKYKYTDYTPLTAAKELSTLPNSF